MASTQALKSRIRSVKSTRQITKAMQLVAASKMRKAQEATKASAPYTLAARELLTALSTHISVKNRAPFISRPINSNIVRVYANELKADDAAGIKNTTITVGRKAAQFVSRIKDTEVLGSYEELPDRPDGSELRAILDSARTLFMNETVDAVDIIYTDFVNSVNQQAKTFRVLPAGFEPAAETNVAQDVLYEPSTEEVVDGIVYRLVGAQIYQALLDARASEHSMRMMAMKNATDNASDLVEDLTLEMNKARQAAITQELAEISGGVAALSD